MLHLEIITPDKAVFSGEVDTVFVPGTKGAFQVLKNHAPIISTLGKGEVRYRIASKEVAFLVEGGVVEVAQNNVRVLVERILEEA